VRVLVACEFSGAVAQAFRDLGHDAWSCDLVDGEHDHHIKADVLTVIGGGWDIMIAHPPCDYLAVSGNRWFSDTARAKPGVLVGQARRDARDAAVQFVRDLWDAPIPRVAVENPVSRLSTLWMRPTQIIHPWQFGHGETKQTALWLRGLPPLKPTNIVDGREQRIWKMPPGPNRKKERSRTYAGIARAMAEQWGNPETPHDAGKDV
jgi:hypothetical protein